MKLCLFKVAKSDACIRPLFANPVTYHDMKFALPKIKNYEISPQISLTKCVYMTNTLYITYTVKSCISVFLIIKYNIDSDFCLYHISRYNYMSQYISLHRYIVAVLNSSKPCMMFNI